MSTALDLLRNAAERGYIGEPVSQLEHALQCARLAAEAGATDEVILAALFHDIGHLCAPEGAASMDGLGVEHHERHGASFLESQGFSKTVSQLVLGHVAAKRYLVAQRPAYIQQLSEASLQTLKWQGGPMSDAEALAFRESPGFADGLRVRAWDERAKILGWDVPSLESYRPMIERHLAGQR